VVALLFFRFVLLPVRFVTYVDVGSVRGVVIMRFVGVVVCTMRMYECDHCGCVDVYICVGVVVDHASVVCVVCCGVVVDVVVAVSVVVVIIVVVCDVVSYVVVGYACGVDVAFVFVIIGVVG